MRDLHEEVLYAMRVGLRQSETHREDLVRIEAVRELPVARLYCALLVENVWTRPPRRGGERNANQRGAKRELETHVSAR